MHLHHWCVDGADAVAQCDAGMRVGTGIQHDAIGLAEAGLLQTVDELAFTVALEVVDVGLAFIALAQRCEVVVETLRTVDTRFPSA